MTLSRRAFVRSGMSPDKMLSEERDEIWKGRCSIIATAPTDLLKSGILVRSDKKYYVKF